MLHTKAGTFELHTRWALEYEQSMCCSQAFAQLRGGEHFVRLGFADIHPAPDVETAVRDTAVAQHMFRFASSFCGYRLANKMQFSRSLPGLAVLLLHDDKEVVENTLRRLKTIFEILERMESLRASRLVAQWLHAVPWRSWVWVRSLLVRLSEYSFKIIPASLQAELVACFNGVMTTDLVENGFRVLRGVVSNNPRGDCGRSTRWSSLRHSPLLQDFDRRPMPETAASTATAKTRRIPPTAYDADVRDFSLGGMASLNELTADAVWTSPTAPLWRSQGFAIEAMLATRDQGLQTLHKCWSSLLLPSPRGVTFRRPVTHWLVLYTTRWGCVL